MPPIRYLLAAFLSLAAATIALSIAGGVSDPVAAQEPPEPQVQLYAGWNNVLYQGIALTLPDALNDARSEITTVWRFVAQTQAWQVWQDGLPASVASLDGLEPAGVYFVFSRSARVWTQPLSPPEALPPPAEPEPEPDPVPWAVTFTRSTAVFGLVQTIQFDESGQGTGSRNGGSPQPISVSRAAVAAIDQMLTDNDFFREEPTNSVSGCGNCFRYSITISDRSGGVVVLESDDVGLSGALFALVEQLSAILIPAVGQ